MYRKVGEIFEYNGNTLIVNEATHSTCDGCYFEEEDVDCYMEIEIGACSIHLREDQKSIIFRQLKKFKFLK